MYWRILFPILTLSFLISFTSCEKREEEAIRQKAQAYADAFDRRDAEALAALWAEDGEYVLPETGDLLEGREAIKNHFQDTFQDIGDAKIEIEIESITFPTSSKAIETGTATLISKGEEETETAYKATYEKQNGDWLLVQVREVDLMEPPSHYEHLKELEWLVGEWVDEDQDSKILLKNEWDKYKNFLTQYFSITVEGILKLEGKQIIAWDPISKHIRSWVFDSDGGFGEGKWTKKGNSWVVESSQTLSDGRRATAINIYTPINQNSYKWESTGREVGGELLPDIEPVTVVRKRG